MPKQKVDVSLILKEQTHIALLIINALRTPPQ